MPETEMKALTLWAPWAHLIPVKAKRFETRGWNTSHRGPLAIHASAAAVKMEYLLLPGIEQALRENGVVPANLPLESFQDYLPQGAVLCIANLVQVHRTDILTAPGEFQLTDEYLFGNYEPGRFAFELEILEVFDPPIPAKGAQGLWTWTRPASDLSDPLTPEESKTMKDRIFDSLKPGAKSAKAADFAASALLGTEADPDGRLSVQFSPDLSRMSVTTTKEPEMKKTPETKIDETAAASEKDAIGKAFDNAAPIEKKSEPAAEEASAPVGAPSDAALALLPGEKVTEEEVGEIMLLPTFQKVVFTKFSVEDKASKMDQTAALQVRLDEFEVEKKKAVDKFNEEIKSIEVQMKAIAAQVTKGGEEREVEVRRLIDEKKGVAVLFRPDTMEVMERRRLNVKELQTEMRLRENLKAAAEANPSAEGKPAGKVVEGKFPQGQKIGAVEPVDKAAKEAEEGWEKHDREKAGEVPPENPKKGRGRPAKNKDEA